MNPGKGAETSKQVRDVKSVLLDESIYTKIVSKSENGKLKNRFRKKNFEPVDKITGECVQLLNDDRVMFIIETSLGSSCVTYGKSYDKNGNTIYIILTEPVFYSDIYVKSKMYIPDKVDGRDLVEAMSQDGCTFANLHEMLNKK